MDARFPDPDGFLAGEIEVDTAAIPSMQALDAPERAELVAAIRDEMAGPLAEVTRDGQVVMPFHVLIVSATRSGLTGADRAARPRQTATVGRLGKLHYEGCRTLTWGEVPFLSKG